MESAGAGGGWTYEDGELAARAPKQGRVGNRLVRLPARRRLCMARGYERCACLSFSGGIGEPLLISHLGAS